MSFRDEAQFILNHDVLIILGSVVNKIGGGGGLFDRLNDKEKFHIVLL